MSDNNNNHTVPVQEFEYKAEMKQLLDLIRPLRFLCFQTVRVQ